MGEEALWRKTHRHKEKHNNMHSKYILKIELTQHIEATVSLPADTEHQLAQRILCYIENWQIYVSTDVCSSQIYEFAAFHAGCETVHHCYSPAVDPHSRFPNVCEQRIWDSVLVTVVLFVWGFWFEIWIWNLTAWKIPNSNIFCYFCISLWWFLFILHLCSHSVFCSLFIQSYVLTVF